MVNISPIRIAGEWLYGYALDYHTVQSEYIYGNSHGGFNFDNTRSEMGELVYRIKYKSDRILIKTISETATVFIRKQRWQPDVIIPVPPSNVSRSYQPVIEIAECISAGLHIECFPECIEKIYETPELKNVEKYKDRISLMHNAFSVKHKHIVDGKNILLFDDLYRSGATLNSIARILHQDGNAKHIFTLTLTKTRSRR